VLSGYKKAVGQTADTDAFGVSSINNLRYKKTIQDGL